MNSPLHFDSVTIIGVGLLGGSLGLALKRRGLVRQVIGIGHRQASLDSAIAVGAIDVGHLGVTDEASQADLIVIATPAAQAARYLDEIRGRAAQATIVTDVVSTKGEICGHARRTWASPCRFVGSHPMAGSEKWGPEHSTSDLYEGAVTFVECGEHLDTAARATVCRLWESLGSTVVDVAPDEHDRLVAATSHLPHIVAAALAQGLPESDAVRSAVGPGFRDTTRVAGGRPELWRDICLTNRPAIETVLNQMQSRLREVGEALASGDGPALEAFFARGAAAREKVLDE